MLPVVLLSLPSGILSHTLSLKAKLTLIVLFCHSVCSFLNQAITWYKENTAVNKTNPHRIYNIHVTEENKVYSSRIASGKIKNKTPKR